MPVPCPLLAQARDATSERYSVSFPLTVPKDNLHLYDKIQETYATVAVRPFFLWQ